MVEGNGRQPNWVREERYTDQGPQLPRTGYSPGMGIKIRAGFLNVLNTVGSFIIGEGPGKYNRRELEGFSQHPTYPPAIRRPDSSN